MKHSDIDKLVDKAIKDNPKSVIDYRNGLHAASKYILGQVMKYSKGQADPAVAYNMILSRI